ncbi:hypothetical protein JCM10213_007184 [Rhodosporidiobolus nylandii]
MKLHAPLLALLALAAGVSAQLATVVDAGSGETVVISVATDADGDPSATAILSTLTDAAAAAETTTATTATTETTDDVAPTAVGQPAVVQQPASTCTTAGCPVKPTTYTQNGVIVTWTATTPTTPIPSATSSGQILNIASYITSVSSATGRSGAGSRFSSSFLPFGTAGDWGIMAGVAVVGGMVGAVAVL